jgi:hypothetical protein
MERRKDRGSGARQSPCPAHKHCTKIELMETLSYFSIYGIVFLNTFILVSRSLTVSIKVNWDDQPKTRVFISYYPPWTWEEYDDAMNKAYHMVMSVEHTVDLLIYNPTESRLPPGNALGHIQRTVRVIPPNVGIIMVVETNRALKVIKSILSRADRAFGSRLVFVNSLEEARDILEVPVSEDTCPLAVAPQTAA